MHFIERNVLCLTVIADQFSKHQAMLISNLSRLCSIFLPYTDTAACVAASIDGAEHGAKTTCVGIPSPTIGIKIPICRVS